MCYASVICDIEVGCGRKQGMSSGRLRINVIKDWRRGQNIFIACIMRMKPRAVNSLNLALSSATSPPYHSMDRVIIIGTGVFGLSTADHIHQKWPSAQLSIVSRPSTLAPSDDISKIVRVDYSNAERMTEAVAAQKQWNSDTKFSKYQRSIGRVVIYEQDDAATVQKINEVREELGLSRREPGDRTLMKDTFGTAAAPESLTYISAPDDSIVDWEPCISVARARAKDACVNSGGTFYESGVTRLFQDGNRVTSLMLENGEAVEAGDAQIVLAVGPWFAQVLDASDIPLPPAGRIPVATGLFSYNVQLNEEQTKFFRGKPMVSHRGKGRCFSARPFFPLAD